MDAIDAVERVFLVAVVHDVGYFLFAAALVLDWVALGMRLYKLIKSHIKEVWFFLWRLLIRLHFV